MREATLLKLSRIVLRSLIGGMGLLVGAIAAEVQVPNVESSPRPEAAALNQPVASLDDLKKRAKEVLELTVEGDATLVGAPQPIAVEFKGSKRVAMLVADDLTRRGVTSVGNATDGPTSLKLSARVSMRGPAGRMSFDLGTMFDKIMAGKSAAEQAQIDPEQNAVFGATAYARTAGLERIGLFGPYLYQYFSVMSIADALGVHSSVNKALTGDNRGVCLINCDNWKNTHHWVIVDAVVVRDGQEKTARAVLKAWMTEIDPQTTFDIAYQAILQDRLLLKEPQ